MEEVSGEESIERVRSVPVNYPSNSHKKNEEKPKDDIPKKVEKIVTGKVVQKKKGLAQKIAETFIGDDIGSASNFVLFEVIIPATKNMIREGVSEGVERLLFGEVRGRRPQSGGIAGRSNYVSYDRYSSSQSKPAPSREISRRGRASHDFSEIVLDSRGEVEAVIDNMLELINDYGVATLSDLYDLVGITGNFMDRKWGWTNLDDATATRVRNGNGYLLNIPRPQPVD